MFGKAKSKVISFTATQNPASALKFYRDTLGLTFVSEDPFAIVFDLDGTMLRVQKVKYLIPPQHTVLGWEVTDILEVVKDLKKRGVCCELFPGLAQDESGVWSAPSGAKVAWFKDPDGNILSITQFPA
jgi:catechol 2,3-dioxygenase-like lactoylglutathione lyase family enzyme